MSFKQERFRIAVLDDYQNVALSLADWSVLDVRATVTVFNDHLADSDERLQPFDIVCVMRERTPMTRAIIERLPKLRLIASTATRNASICLSVMTWPGRRSVSSVSATSAVRRHRSATPSV
jgi:phosphoglycerate dehydrogenase-like enzyme